MAFQGEAGPRSSSLHQGFPSHFSSILTLKLHSFHIPYFPTNRHSTCDHFQVWTATLSGCSFFPHYSPEKFHHYSNIHNPASKDFISNSLLPDFPTTFSDCFPVCHFITAIAPPPWSWQQKPRSCDSCLAPLLSLPLKSQKHSKIWGAGSVSSNTGPRQVWCSPRVGFCRVEEHQPVFPRHLCICMVWLKGELG